ncbi:hypothetical protein Anas_12688 [Armadillidium nasatum]|uniref:Transmembrane protein n=1 Tax=Armadillidium nasatum TaxID=96803 RepID=A0A5N5T595_9CRUS|nr:hypothetical protein Anas_12688 [Armadillidium nasatum]
MVGTFITAHAYLSNHDSHYHLKVEHVLRILGPILLGCGGVILLGISATCLCVYKRNKTIRHIVTAEDFCNIGASTFYDQRHVLCDTIDLINSFLTKAVLHERRRKLSKNIPQVRNIQSFEEETSSNSSPVSASPLRDFHKRNPIPKRSIPLKAHHLDYIELQNLKRAIPHESLALSDDGDDGNESPQPTSRQSYSPEVIESLIEIADKQDFRNPLQINAKTVFSSLQHRNQLNTNEPRNIIQSNEISDKNINIKGSPDYHKRGDFLRVNRNSDDLPSVEDYESQPYNIDGSSIDLRQKRISGIRNSEGNFDRNSLGVQTLKRNFENLSRRINNSHETRTKSSKDMVNIKLQTNADGQNRCSHTVVENSESQPPSPVSRSESSCSICSSPPPSPTKASFTALNIMQDLCQETPLPQRNQKTLSIISSQDEYYETD